MALATSIVSGSGAAVKGSHNPSVIVEHGQDMLTTTLEVDVIKTAFDVPDGMSETTVPSDDLRFQDVITVEVATLLRTY